MIVITGTVRIPVGTLDRVRPAMRAMVDASRAEDGCLHYAYGEDVFEPGLIWVSESWRDGAALELHAKSAHMATWRAAGAELGLHDRNLTLYEAVSAKPL
ncbi:MAG: antibiotic biosynthesis monooxygenase [Caulobacteraceae bacterium]|jgi:quinol monooxygenase YgiN|nr:antibiotic biosynthesis monooxygenase [Caulobacteraceae bacterium]